MRDRRLFNIIFCIFLLLIALSTSVSAAGDGDIFAVWRGASFNDSSITQLKTGGFNGVILDAVTVRYNPESHGWIPKVMDLSGLAKGSASGMKFHLLIKLQVRDAGWPGGEGLNVLASMVSDMSRMAIANVQKAGGDVAGLVLYPEDASPKLDEMAQFIKWLKNNPAISGTDVKIGGMIKPSMIDSETFEPYASAAAYFLVDLANKNPDGDPPSLTEPGWASQAIGRLDDLARPMIALLPMRERVIRRGPDGKVIDSDFPLTFERVMRNAGDARSDAANNPTAIYKKNATVDGIGIPSGTIFTHLLVEPAQLTDIGNAIIAGKLENLRAFALDSLPYTPSPQGFPVTDYLAALKEVKLPTAPAPSSPTTGTSTAGTPDEKVAAFEKGTSSSKAFWKLGLFLLLGCAIAGLSLYRKRKLTYDEETDTLKHHRGDDE